MEERQGWKRQAGKHWSPEGATITSVSRLQEGAALLHKSCLVRIVERAGEGWERVVEVCTGCEGFTSSPSVFTDSVLPLR